MSSAVTAPPAALLALPSRRSSGGRSSAKEFFRAFEKAFSERRVFLATQFGKLLQLRALLGIESGRHFHHDAHKEITAGIAVKSQPPVKKRIAKTGLQMAIGAVRGTDGEADGAIGGGVG